MESMRPLRPRYDGAPGVMHPSRKILAMSMHGEFPKSIGFFRHWDGASRQMARGPTPFLHIDGGPMKPHLRPTK